MQSILIGIINLYQRTLSPDTGWFKIFYPLGYCKFTPTCSQYCKESIEKRGVIIGTGKGLWRIMRCNPWNKGGVDPA